MQNVILICVSLASAIMGLGVVKRAAAGDSDQAVLNHLLGERTLQQNAVQLCRAARRLPIAERYETLIRWVFPGEGHGLRIGGEIIRSPGYSDDQADQRVSTLADYPESNWIVCPARDLVDVAETLGRLPELSARVNAVQPASESQSLARRTLLTLIHVAENDRDAVEQALADRFTEIRRWTDDNAHTQWWTDMLVLWSVAENSQTADLVLEDFFGVYPQLRTYIPNSRLDTIADYLSLLQAHCTRRRHAIEPTLSEQWLDDFDVFSRIGSKSHARAAPLPRFCFDDRGVVKISGHEFDYFAFSSPLSGTYEVVADVATRSGAFSQLMVEGVACRPVSELNEVSISRFGGGSQTGRILPNLESVDARTFLRAIRSDERTEHHCNGHSVLSYPSNVSSAPWAAIRSWRRTESETTDFRIAGTPVVPDTVDLLADDALSGWASYFDSENGDWRRENGKDGSKLLVCDRSENPTGSFDECLLYYVRPLVWDARITYEFQYIPGSHAVDPCLGRLAFQIRPEGVRLHRITDGRFERSSLRPDKVITLNQIASQELLGPVATPDLRNGWNQAEVAIQGDQIEIVLNGDTISRQRIQPNSARTFGFFHYRDLSRAAVRNIRLTGDWPKSTPSSNRHSLFPQIVAELNAASEKLPARWFHDFRTGAGSDFFHLGGNTERVTQRPDGLHMNRMDDSDKLAIDFCGIIDGDFDIIARFKDLQIGDQTPTWHCGFGMATHLQNEDRSRLDICLRRDRLNSLHHIAFSHNEVNTFGGIRWISDSNLRDQSSSGRLRLIRRGNTVFGFFAGGNSESFRPIGSVTVPSGPIPPQMLRLYTVGGDGMHVSGTWVDLSIRADHIDFLKPSDDSVALQELAEVREHGSVFQVDFATESYEESGLVISSGSTGDLEPSTRGLIVNAVGGVSYRRTALIKPMRPTQSFDVEWDFEVMSAAGAVPEGMTTEAVLGVNLVEELPVGDDPTHLPILEATIISRYKPDGRIVLRARIVARRNDGKLAYIPLRMREIDSPVKYRIAQKDGTLYFLYRDIDSSIDQIIATYPTKNPVSATSAEIWAIGSRDNGEIHVLSKRLAIHQR